MNLRNSCDDMGIEGKTKDSGLRRKQESRILFSSYTWIPQNSAKGWKPRRSLLWALIFSALANVLVVTAAARFSNSGATEYGDAIEVEIANASFKKEIPPISEIMQFIESDKNREMDSTDGQLAISNSVLGDNAGGIESSGSLERSLSSAALQGMETKKSGIVVKPTPGIAQRRREVDAIVREMKFLGAGEGAKDGVHASNKLPAGMQVGDSFRSRGDAAGRGKLLKKYGGDLSSEAAVNKALEYLAKRQNPDGSWGGKDSRKTGDNIALTALALLAFLSHGEGFESASYGKNVVKGAECLSKFAAIPNIELAGKGFGHAILTYALAEAYAATGSLSLKNALEPRLKSIVGRQNKFGSFNVNYDNTPQDVPIDADPAKTETVLGEPACDLPLLAWHVQAMTSAKTANVTVNGMDRALELATESLVKIHQADSGGFTQGINMKRFPANDRMTPVGLLCLQFLNAGASNVARRAEAVMNEKHGKAVLPKWQGGAEHPLYRWYYQTQAIFKSSKGVGKEWSGWNENMKTEFTKNQAADGSWLPPKGDSNFKLKDKVDLELYATSLSALTLQVYYRYLPSYSLAESEKLKDSSADDLDLGISGLITRLPGGVDPIAGAVFGTGGVEMSPIAFGVFDGQPAAPSAPHRPDEFKIYASFASTVPVRKKADWPQTLQPRQRLALFLDELLPEGYKGSLKLQIAICCPNKEAMDFKVSIEALMNGRRLYDSYIQTDKALATILIPASFLQESGNMLQLRNNGSTPIGFDAAELSPVDKVGRRLRLVADNLDQLPPQIQGFFNMGKIDIGNEGDLKEIPLRITKVKGNGAEPIIDASKCRPERFHEIVDLHGGKVNYWILNPKDEKFRESRELLFKANPAAQLMLFEACEDKAITCFPLSAHAEYRPALQPLSTLGSYSTQNECLGHWDCVGAEEMGASFQRDYLRHSGREIVDWISGGGSGVILSEIVNGGKMYDPIFKTERPALAALKQASKLFDGTAYQLPATMWPTQGDDPIYAANVAAAYNAPGVATVVVAKRFPIPQETQVVAMLPWDGVTEMSVEKGFFLKGAPFSNLGPTLEAEQSRIQVENGEFRFTGVLPEMTVIRLSKKGAKPLAKREEAAPYLPQAQPFELNNAKVTAPDTPEGYERVPLRSSQGFFSTLGNSETCQLIPSTTGKSVSPGQFSPPDSQSVEASFVFGHASKQNSSVYLSLGGGPEEPSLFGFAVYPKATVESDGNPVLSVPFRFAFSNQAYQVRVQLNKWQRVCVPVGNGIRAPYWSFIRILEPPHGSEKVIKSISYEINDVAVYKKQESVPR